MLQRAQEASSRSRKYLQGHELTVLQTRTLEDALNSLETGTPRPRSPSTKPPAVVDRFTSILHQCRKSKSPPLVSRLHACMRENGLDCHRSLGNQLVSLLVDVGSVQNAQQVFDKLRYRTECSWTSLINGYIKSGKPRLAFSLYERMREDCVEPSGYTFVALLKACSKLRDAERGHRMLRDISRRGLQGDLFVGSALVDMFGKLDLLEKAREVFDQLRVRDAMSWNALINGYARHGHCEEAVECFDRMQLDGVDPSLLSFVGSVKACGGMRASGKGRSIHCEASRRGFDVNLVIGNALIDMYGNCGVPDKAREVFDRLPDRDVISWTALISGYVKHGHAEEAVGCYEKMKLQGFTPDAVTLVCCLKACSMSKLIDVGRDVHAEIARDSSMESNQLVGNALVDMYAKCGMLGTAEEVLVELGDRDVATWNSLIGGYIKQGLHEEALACFDRMRTDAVPPDEVTFSCVLKACGSLGATDRAIDAHEEVSKRGLLEGDPVMGNGLVDMYTKCGLLHKAQEAFDKLGVRDLVSWNSLMAGYAQLGESGDVFLTFDRMVREEESPDQVTFGSVLNVCIHAGLVTEGQSYFHAMVKGYGMVPSVELHKCVIDLLSRAGQLDRAFVMSKEMPVHPNLVLWNTVLGACRKWGNVQLGKRAFDHAVGVEEKDCAAYVCMYNIYADAGMMEEAEGIETMRVQKQAWGSHGEDWWSDGGG